MEGRKGRRLAVPALVAAFASEQAAIVPVPGRRDLLVGIEAALFGEQGLQLGIARLDLLARGLGSAGDRKAAAKADGGFDELAADLRGPHRAAQRRERVEAQGPGSAIRPRPT